MRRPELGALMGGDRRLDPVRDHRRELQPSVAQPDGAGGVDPAGGLLRDHRGPGGAADDRRRVRPLHRRDVRRHRDRPGASGGQVPLGHVAGDRRHGRVRRDDRPAQRLHRGQEQAAELHRHAGDILHPARRERRRRAAAQQREHQRHGEHTAPGGAVRREVDLRQLVLLKRCAAQRLQHRDHLVHLGDDHRLLGPQPHLVRQLDLRLGRRAERSAQRRCARATGPRSCSS